MGIKEKLKSIPEAPGVYFFHRKNIFILIRKPFQPSENQRRFQDIFSKKTAQLERPGFQFSMVELGFEQLMAEMMNEEGHHSPINQEIIQDLRFERGWNHIHFVSAILTKFAGVNRGRY